MGPPQAYSEALTVALSDTANITGTAPGKSKLLKGLSPRQGQGFLVRARETRLFVQALNRRFLNVYVAGLTRFGNDIGGLLGFEPGSEGQATAKQACLDAEKKIASSLRRKREDVP